jgi:hypothetical protein
MIHEELSGTPRFLVLRMRDWNGNAYCAREKLSNPSHLIFMPEPYPCYPCNPWLGLFERILVSLMPKEFR